MISIRLLVVLVLVVLLISPGRTNAASSPPPIDDCVTMASVLHVNGSTWIPDHESAGLESHEYDVFSGLPLLSYDFFDFRIGNAGHSVSIGSYTDGNSFSMNTLSAGQQVTVSAHTDSLTIWSDADFGSIEICKNDVEVILPTFTNVFPAMQSTFDTTTTVSMTEAGMLVIGAFTIYLMFEFLLIILDRRRRRA